MTAAEVRLRKQLASEWVLITDDRFRVDEVNSYLNLCFAMMTVFRGYRLSLAQGMNLSHRLIHEQSLKGTLSDYKNSTYAADSSFPS